jgi:hypothetical protein
MTVAAVTAEPTSSRAPGFADAGRLMPIGGVVPGDVAAIDRALLLVAKRASAVDGAPREGMWRTWKLAALSDAEDEARAAIGRALVSLGTGGADLLALVEERRAGLDAFLARYLGRRP